MRLTIRPTIRPDRPARYVVLSPDDLPIRPRPFPSRRAAERALAAWCGRFTLQGYYKACAGRLSLEELPARCRIEAVGGAEPPPDAWTPDDRYAGEGDAGRGALQTTGEHLRRLEPAPSWCSHCGCPLAAPITAAPQYCVVCAAKLAGPEDR